MSPPEVSSSAGRETIIDGSAYLGVAEGLPAVTTNALKRLLDVVIAFALLLLVLPVLLLLCLIIRLESRGPSLFGQKRRGLNGKPFTILKLRTMRLSKPDGVTRNAQGLGEQCAVEDGLLSCSWSGGGFRLSGSLCSNCV